jgi:tetratricopeptide (TPR) repeat protein
MDRGFEALCELLLDLFDDGGLRRWVRRALGTEVYQALPGSTVAFDELCFQVASLAQQRGLVDESFFENLTKERQGKAQRIHTVAAQWREAHRDSAPSSSRPGDANALPLLPTDHLPEEAPLPRPFRMHMRRNPQFVGRIDQLLAIASALQVDGKAAIGQVASVTGLGGIGKTQLAAEFVHRYGQFFAGGVFWLNFADRASVATEFALCGGPGHLELWTNESAPDIATQVDRVRSVFAGPEPRLLVFDNCEDEALLTEYLPASGGSRVLVTSRRSTLSAHLGVLALPLDVLARAESLALLRALAHEQPFAADDEDALDAICAELGDLPLALHLAGSFLACYRDTTTPAAYPAELRDQALLEHESLQGDGTESSPTHHELHVRKTFAMSWDRLDPEGTVDAMARDLLLRAACLAPGEPIPHALLVATLGEPEDDRAARTQAKALRRLLDLGLLDKPKPDTYRIHRLVSAFAQQTDGDHTAARAAVEEALLGEAHRVNDSGYPAHLLPWQPHLRAVTDIARAREDEQAADLCNQFGGHLHDIGNYHEARIYYERGLAICEKLFGPEHLDTARHLNSLGLLLWDQDAPHEARSLFERILAIHERQLEPEYVNIATSMDNLALALQDLEDYAEARALHERALAIRESHCGAEHEDTGASLNNLANLLREQGDLSEARLLFERALAIAEIALGAEHPVTAKSLGNLAKLLSDQGDFIAARPLLERALATLEKQLGPEHPHTGTALDSLAKVLAAQEAYEEARALYERALTICEKQLGPDHPDIATTLNNLARLLHQQEAYEEARPLYERALAIRETQLGGQHPDTAESLNNLAALMLDQGDHSKARPLFKRALAIFEATLGPNDPTTRLVRGNLRRLPKSRVRRRGRRPSS